MYNMLFDKVDIYEKVRILPTSERVITMSNQITVSESTSKPIVRKSLRKKL